MNRWAPDYVYEYPAPSSLDGVLWPQERVTIKQMIRSFTIGGAKAAARSSTTRSDVSAGAA